MLTWLLFGMRWGEGCRSKGEKEEILGGPDSSFRCRRPEARVHKGSGLVGFIYLFQAEEDSSQSSMITICKI